MLFKWVMLAVMPLLAQGVFADDYTCPASLEVKEQLVSDPADWSTMFAKSSGDIVYMDSREATDTLKLVEITLYSGEPKNDELLAPDNADDLSEDEESDSVWSLGSAEDQQTNPIYIACNYGSSISVFKKTTAPVKSCSWHFKPTGDNNILTCTSMSFKVKE